MGLGIEHLGQLEHRATDLELTRFDDLGHDERPGDGIAEVGLLLVDLGLAVGFDVGDDVGEGVLRHVGERLRTQEVIGVSVADEQPVDRLAEGVGVGPDVGGERQQELGVDQHE